MPSFMCFKFIIHPFYKYLYRLQCPRANWVCVPNPDETGCIAECGGADCGGVCAEDKLQACGGISGTQCSTDIDSDIQCIDDEFDDGCNTECGGADCTGNCYDIMEPIECGGIGGIECPNDDQVCVDDPSDDCDPDCGDADCSGFCAKLDGNSCGGIYGAICTGDNYVCLDEKGDSCSSKCSGADCGGQCAEIVYI